MRVGSLGREDPLEEEMATHSSILAWRIPWTEEPGGLVHGVAKSQKQLRRTFSLLRVKVPFPRVSKAPRKVLQDPFFKKLIFACT